LKNRNGTGKLKGDEDARLVSGKICAAGETVTIVPARERNESEATLFGISRVRQKHN
jgi:hypothetical protein